MIIKNERNITEVYDVDTGKLGSGSYGTVTKGIHKVTKQERAVKTIPLKKIKNMERFRTEVKILQTLDHPHVIKLYEYFEDDTNVYLIMEICTGGELFDRIIEKEYFSERYAAKVFKQILQAINYCHTQGVCHRDLKPENFLYETKDDESDIKVIDFGLSKILDASTKGLQRMKTKAGTPYYISPEVLTGNYDLACDLWSAGCILYILLCGYPPFYGDDDQEILRMVKKGRFDFDGEEWDEVSEEAKDLIKKLITKPERRLTAQEALNHTWIKHLAANSKKDKLTKLNMGQFKKFQHQTKLKQAALTCIAVQANPNDIKELKNIFQAMDENGDGSLTLEELKHGLQDVKNGQEILDLMQAADTDNSGTINYTEFLAATMDAQIFMREENLRQAFMMFDKDGSGEIDANEIRALLEGDDMKGQVDQRQLQDIIQEVDANGDGVINFEEFLIMMRKMT